MKYTNCEKNEETPFRFGKYVHKNTHEHNQLHQVHCITLILYIQLMFLD